MNAINTMFGRINAAGDVDVFEESGEVATRLDADVFPVGSSLSARYEHPAGITITRADAELLGLPIDN